jgi:hypothetical protein
MYKRAGGLVRVLREFCMVQSEVWKVMADLRRNAFGTPMFSQHPDAGYCTNPGMDHGVNIEQCQRGCLL